MEDNLQNIFASSIRDYDLFMHVDFTDGTQIIYRVSEFVTLRDSEILRTMSYQECAVYFADNYVCEEDKKAYYEFLNKDNIVAATRNNDSVYLRIRIINEGMLQWIGVKAVAVESADGHECIAVSFKNIDEIVFDEKERLKELEEKKTSDIISGLTKDYKMLFFVDTTTHENKIIRINSEVKKYIRGIFDTSDFKKQLRIIGETLVHPDDRSRFLADTRKANVLAHLEDSDTYFVNFRYIAESTVENWQAKFSFTDDTGQKLIVGFHNIDREAEYNNELRKEKQRLNAVLADLIEDFDYIFYVDIMEDKEKDVVTVYKTSPVLEKLIPEFNNDIIFGKKLDLVAKHLCYDADIEKFIEKTQRKVVLESLENNKAYFVNTRFKIFGETHFYQFKFTAERNEQGKLVGVVLGVHSIDDETKAEIQKRKEVENLIRIQTEELRNKNIYLNHMNTGIIDLMGYVVDSRDADSGKHIKRIKYFTYLLANMVKNTLPEYELTEQKVNIITSSAALHDVGKIKIPDSVLLKPGKLTSEEFDIMKTHTTEGCEILKRMTSFWSEDYLSVAMNICRYHHEKWDGSGYPDKLVGDAIPIEAQIVAVADCYDALTKKRVYKDAYNPDKAFDMIVAGECGVFSPKLMKCFSLCRDSFKSYALDTDKVEVQISNIDLHTNNKYEEKAVLNELTMPVLKKLLDDMPGAFVMFKSEGDGEIIYCNDLVPDLYGFASKEQLLDYVGGTFRGMIQDENFATVFDSIFDQVVSNDMRLHKAKFMITRRDGEKRWVEEHGRMVKTDALGEISFIFLNDVTETVILQDAIEKARELEQKQKLLESYIDDSYEVPGDNGIFQRAKILIVDDNDYTRELEADLLRSEGADVIEAENGEIAFKLIKDGNEFDAILMDVIMPVMDGIEATREIRNFEKKNNTYTPVISISADNDSNMRFECLKAGADEFMIKPLVPSVLSNVLFMNMKEQSAKIEKKLADTLRIANTDVLTKVKNITAYTDKVAEISTKISGTEGYTFAIVMCDINGLKNVNDNFGHDAGDIYIKNCCHIISDVFSSSKVYRIGGDEFAVILENADFEHSKRKMEQLKERIAEAEKYADVEHGKASFAAGLAVYDYQRDYSVSDVMKRADKEMYSMKQNMK